jgi:hypothetical protein
MNRRLFITIHLYLSSFFAAAVLLVAISGGLYLLGYKGKVAETPVATLPKSAHDLPAQASKSDVAALLAAAGVEDFDFEYVRQNENGKRAVTRPTSRVHYLIDARGRSITVSRAEPDLQARMIELHKGHGPTAFKQFQKFFAAGMLFIILSGLWLGLSAERLRKRTGLAFGAGLAIFLALMLV